jgi:K+-sensing histidine kinase KdpD
MKRLLEGIIFILFVIAYCISRVITGKATAVVAAFLSLNSIIVILLNPKFTDEKVYNVYYRSLTL